MVKNRDGDLDHQILARSPKSEGKTLRRKAIANLPSPMDIVTVTMHLTPNNGVSCFVESSSPGLSLPLTPLEFLGASNTRFATPSIPGWIT